MEKLNRDNRPFFLLSVLSQALSHRLRTPLSVVSNDLFYFKSVLPAGECEKTLEKCREISSILSAASKLRWPFESQSFNGGGMVEEIFGSSHVTPGEKWQGLYGNGEYFHWALSALSNLGFSMLSCQSDSLLLKSDMLDGLQGSYCSLSEALNVSRGLDSIETALLDAVFWAHGLSLKIRNGKAEIYFEPAQTEES